MYIGALLQDLNGTEDACRHDGTGALWVLDVLRGRQKECLLTLLQERADLISLQISSIDIHQNPCSNKVGELIRAWSKWGSKGASPGCIQGW